MELSSSLDEKTTNFTPETNAFSNQVIDGGGTHINIERHAVENGGIAAGEDGFVVQTAVGEDGLVAQMTGETVSIKRKIGRPRKYEVSGEILSPSSETPSYSQLSKRRRGRPPGSGRLQLLAASGGEALDTAGGSFTPHVVNVATGEDIVKRISTFSGRGPRAICILSATGAVSNVMIHQSASNSKSGCIFRYEGLFEILSLCGSYVAEMNGSHRKKGMMSISLAQPDGRVFGGAVASSLIAATPVQIIVASFKQNISNAIKKWHRAALNPTTGNEEANDAPTTPLQMKQQLFQTPPL